MAYNPYNQVYRQQLHQVQSQPQVRQMRNQAPADQGGRQFQREERPRPQAAATNRHEYHDPSGWQNGMSRQNQQWEQWEQPREQSRPQQAYEQQPYPQEQDSYGGYGNAEPQRPGQGQDRVYQYDERYHHENNGNSRHNGRQQNGGEARTMAEQRPAQPEVKKSSKPRERILTRPESPETISWDSPFPSFGPNKKGNKKSHSSLDKDVGNHNTQPRKSSESRPTTAQSNRPPPTDTRPNTSHGYSQPDRQLLESPALPQQQPPMSPLRKDPPKGYNYGRPAESQLAQNSQFPAPVRPAPNPLVGNGEQRTGSLRDQAFSEVPMAPQRSMTMPDEMPLSQRMTPNPQSATSYWPASGRPGYGGEPRDEPYSASYADPTQFGSTDTRSRSSDPRYVRPQESRFNANQYPISETQDMPAGHELPVLHPDTRFHQPHDPDVPRFDAIASPVTEKLEDFLPATQNTTLAQPAYRKKNYQAVQSPPQRFDHGSVDPSFAQGSQGRQSPLSGFQFDLPRNQAPVQTDPMTSNPPFRNLGERIPPQHIIDPRNKQQYGNHNFQPPQQGQRPAGQFPPRDVSRMETQPRSASDAYQHPQTQQLLKQQRSFSDTQRWPQEEPQTPYGNEQGVGRGYRGTGNGEQPYNGRARLRRDYTDESAPQYAAEMGPTRSRDDYTRPSYDSERSQRPSTSGSARPAPVRQYDQQGSAGPIPGQAMPPVGPRSPDSLPMHPVPVRAGLTGQGQVPVSNMPRNGQEGRGQQPVRMGTPQQAVAQPAPAPQAVVKASPKEPPITAYDLNLLQQKVQANPNDHATTLKFAKKLVEAAFVLSDDEGRADKKTAAKNRERYIFDAHKLIKKLVSAGYPDAMFYLADCHGQGLLGLQVDPKEAFHLYTSAAKAGHAQAAYRVAVCCEMGTEEGGGTRRDPLKAMQWYKRAATLGDTAAMYKMGMIQLKGLLGQPKNPREALSWLKRAAERADKDNPHALHELGLLYESAQPNDAIVKDEGYSRQLFTQAGDLGYKYSQFRLGSAYEYGMLGCPVDARQSIAWYSRAAQQGEHQSELALSGWYLTGSEGLMPQSDTEAYLWARKAATAGLAKAEYAMGYFTEVGIGAPADADAAKRWYWKAASQGFPKARERLEALKKGAGKQERTRVSRSGVSKQNEGECLLM